MYTILGAQISTEFTVAAAHGFVSSKANFFILFMKFVKLKNGSDSYK